MTTVASLVLMLMGCGYDSSGVSYSVGEAATITVSLASPDPMTAAGDTQVVTAVVRDGNQAVILSPAVSWRTSAPSVATVAGSGSSATVTAVGDGTAIITAVSGSVEGTVTVTVRRRVASMALSAPDSVLAPGSTTQLTVVGRDARDEVIGSLTGVSFATSNPFSVIVSPSGLVTALFSSFRPFGSTISATVTRDGVTFHDSKRIDVEDAAPAAFDFSAQMQPAGVRPEPVNSAGDGVVFLALNGARVDFQIFWSLLSGPPVSADVHGPDGNDAVADVLVDLPVGNQANTHGVLRGSFSATDIRPQGGRPPIPLDSLVTLMKTPGLAYVDVHTASFGGGEIRGPIFPRP